QERFTYKEVMHPHTAIELASCRLLGCQFDVAANGAATGFFGAAVGCFHDTGPAAGHYCEPESRNCRAHFPGELVMRIFGLNPGRAKNGHTWTDEVQGAKSAQEIAHDSQKGEELGKTRTRPFEEDSSAHSGGATRAELAGSNVRGTESWFFSTKV